MTKTGKPKPKPERPWYAALPRARLQLSRAAADLVQHEWESPVRIRFLRWLARLFLVAGVLAFSGFLISAIQLLSPSTPSDVKAAAAPTPTKYIVSLAAITSTPSFTATPQLPLIALVAGHSGGIDPGAICPDGLKEVDVTMDVAARTKAALETKGYRVDILKEFDPKLNSLRQDYAPRAFLAIHADSCVYYASGYKVARALNSASPDEDDRLVRCVSNAYAATTQLPFHPGSITNDMTQYHGLMEIDPRTPAAIIELGFLGSEHNLLKNRRDIVSVGVSAGLLNFMSGQLCQNQ